MRMCRMAVAHLSLPARQLLVSRGGSLSSRQAEVGNHCDTDASWECLPTCVATLASRDGVFFGTRPGHPSHSDSVV